MIHKPKRIVHKHLSYEKFNRAKIDRQNVQMIGRLIETDCEVIKNKNSEHSYKRHLRYSNIRSRYDSQGKRKDSVPLLRSEKLCPTLSEYHKSGLAQKFVNMDMSMSMKPASSQSMRRSYISGSSPSP